MNGVLLLLLGLWLSIHFVGRCRRSSTGRSRRTLLSLGVLIVLGISAAAVNIPPRNPVGSILLVGCAVTAVTTVWSHRRWRGRAIPRSIAGLAFLLGASAAIWSGGCLIAAAHWISRKHPVFAEPVPSIEPHQLTPLRLQTSDGLELGAWWSEGKAGYPTVIGVHGNGASRTRFLPYARFVLARGYSVLFVTVRSHGDSEGSWNDVGWSARLDAIAALEEAQRRRPDAKCIFLGRSLGSAAVLFAADEGVTADAYFLEAPFRDLRTAIHDRIDRKFPALVSWFATEGLLAAGDLWMPNIDDHNPSRRLLELAPDIPVCLLFDSVDRQAPRRRYDGLLNRRPSTHVRELTLGGHRPILPRDRSGFARVWEEWETSMNDQWQRPSH